MFCVVAMDRVLTNVTEFNSTTPCIIIIIIISVILISVEVNAEITKSSSMSRHKTAEQKHRSATKFFRKRSSV